MKKRFSDINECLMDVEGFSTDSNDPIKEIRRPQIDTEFI